jgi:pyruvate/2-oxoglutarate dehydrogenase complex dihydrolipoamide dehydrogenase (E3) component
LDDGVEFVFEKLLIATGGKPIVPNIQGVEKKESTPSQASQMPRHSLTSYQA